MMKITAGLGSIDEYIPYVKAGADELFCGFVPDSFSRDFGLFAPMNRREVLYYNVQIGSLSELRILRRMQEKYPVPVTITLNALTFTPAQFPRLAEYMLLCEKEGFCRFIIADPALLIYLNQQGLSSRFHLAISGELGEMNASLLPLCRRLGADRMIFHRKVPAEDMKSMIGSARENGWNAEFEAFALNEMCHFHGGFCNSLHCDELAHMCLVPYRAGRIRAASGAPGPGASVPGVRPQCGSVSGETGIDPPVYVPGTGGCGLCELYDLQAAGITHLKLVSRGGYVENTLEDIRTMKKALRILEEFPTSRSAYIRQLKQEIFPLDCSGNCYYVRST